MDDPRIRDSYESPVRRDNPFDTPEGYSGQEYTREREATLARLDPPGGKAGRGDTPDAAGDMPPENGRRAFFDPETGAVHGSGSGAGGGNPGEDFDSDPSAGDGRPHTRGREGAPPLTSGFAGRRPS